MRYNHSHLWISACLEAALSGGSEFLYPVCNAVAFTPARSLVRLEANVVSVLPAVLMGPVGVQLLHPLLSH